MKLRKSSLVVMLSIVCAIGLFFGTFFLFDSKNTWAVSITDSTGTTLSSGETASFDLVENWALKTLVFDIKTDGTETQFQLRKSDGGGGTGIIRTKPDRAGNTVHTADACSYQSQSFVDNGNTGKYWGDQCYSISLGDGWYRWVVDLTDLLRNDISTSVDAIKCLNGTDVQIKNLKFYDEIYMYGNSNYGFLNTPFSNWSTEKIQFDLRIPTGTQRRFQLCKDSGSGVSGLIRCEKTMTYVENKEGSPYWLELGAPEALGNDWYHFSIDLSKISIASNKTGTETVDRIKNLPDAGDPIDTEIKNFIVGTPYDPSKEEGVIVLKAGKRTEIPDITNWRDNKVTFDLYQPSLTLSGSNTPQFIFSAKGTENNTTDYLGCINGATKLYFRNPTSNDPYWKESTIQPTSIGNGWYKWTIDFSEERVGPEGDGFETLGSVLNRGNSDVYIKNFVVEKTYDPTQEEGVIVLKAGERTEIPDIYNWKYNKVTFDVYQPSLKLSGDNTPQFIFSAKGTENNTTDYLGCINGETKLYFRNPTSNDPYWKESTIQPTSIGNGWYKWTIDFSEEKVGPEGDGFETLDKILNRGDSDVYIKDFKVEKEFDASSWILFEDGESQSLGLTIPNWKNSKKNIEFDTLGNAKNISILFDGIFTNGEDARILPKVIMAYSDGNGGYYVGCGDVDSERYENVLTNTTVTHKGENVYHWVVALPELTIKNGLGNDTITSMRVIGGDLYVKDIKLTDIPYDMIWTFGETNNLLDNDSQYNWYGEDTKISFEFQGESIPTSNFSFASTETNRITSKFKFADNGKIVLSGNNTVEVGTYIDLEKGWKKAEIDLSKIRTGETVGYIKYVRIDGVGILPVRNYTVTCNPTTDKNVLILKQGISTVLPEKIYYWQYSTIELDVYHPSLTLGRTEEEKKATPQFMLHEEGTSNFTSDYFGFVDGIETLVLRNPSSQGGYWVPVSTQPVSLGGGWYHWVIDLSEEKVGPDGDGTETIGSILNRGNNDVYIRNFSVKTAPFVYIDQKEIIVPFTSGLTKQLNASIVGGSGSIIFESSNNGVASVDRNGLITFNKLGECEITVSVAGDDTIRKAVCYVNSLSLKNYKEFNLDELTTKDQVAFPAIKKLTDQIARYEYQPVSSDNPSVVVKFMVSLSYIEQNRQAVTIWGPSENGISCYDNKDANIWSACWQGALVFDMYGNNGNGGLYVNGGLNVTALNGHNTLVAPFNVGTSYFIEAGAIDVDGLIGGKQLTYFYINVDGVTVWSMLGEANENYRKPIVAFTAADESRATAKKVNFVNITLKDKDGKTIDKIEFAKGIKIPKDLLPVISDTETEKFIGWRKSEDSFWNFDNDLVEKDVTLTAVLSDNFHAVTFNTNYPNGSDEIVTKYVGDAMCVDEISSPSFEGYRFKYWSTSKDGFAFDFKSERITEDTVLYAVWVKTYAVNFVYDGISYLTLDYDENSYVLDPGWGYHDADSRLEGEWKDRGMFVLNDLANGRAPYYSLTPNGEKFDIKTIKVDGEKTIYICFAEIETVKGDDEKFDDEISKWDYVSLKDLSSDKPMAYESYKVDKFDTATGVYTPSKNNTTDSIIFRGKILLGDKFKGTNTNIGWIGLRSYLNVSNSISIWLRTNEVYLKTNSGGSSLYLAFRSYDTVSDIAKYVEVVDGRTYLKTNVYIPIEFAILAVTTPGFENYDRVYFKIGESTLFDVVIPKYGKPISNPTFRVGFFTDGDTDEKGAFKIYGVYDNFTVKFQDAEGKEVSSSITKEKYSKIDKPSYKLPNVAGKKFVGWYNKATKFMWNFSTDKIKKDTVLIPTYGYTVTINPNGGCFGTGDNDDDWLSKIVDIGEGCFISFPDDPKKAVDEDDAEYFYKFAGWITSTGKLWDKENDVVTSTLELTAKWDKYYTVTLNIEDDYYFFDAIDVISGDVLGNYILPDPIAEYAEANGVEEDEVDFLGWFILNAENKYEKVDVETLKVNSKITLYAIFDEVIQPVTPVQPEKPDDGTGCGSSGCSNEINGTMFICCSLFVFAGLMFIVKKKKDNK